MADPKYVSKHYNCEEIDQRLLQGYYDDFVDKTGYSGNKDSFLIDLFSSINLLKDKRFIYLPANIGLEHFPEWSSGNKYLKGKVVFHNSLLFRANSTHTSGASFDDDASLWSTTTLSELVEEDLTSTITVDEMVNFNPLVDEGSSYLAGFLDKPSRYVVTKEVGGVPVNVGILEILSDSSQHIYTQVFTTHFLLDNSGNLDSGAHDDTKLVTYFRSYSIESPLIDSGTWTKWEDISHYDVISATLGFLKYPLFNKNINYSKGYIVRYENHLYRFTSAHEAGAWDGTDVEEWSVKDELDTKTEAEDTSEVINDIEETLVTDALRKSAQILTDSEKRQARKNIGAASTDDYAKAISDLNKQQGVFESSIRNVVKNYKPIVINGNVSNATDEEDITSDENNLLKLKDRNNLDGMGYVILRKNKTFKEQVTQPNTIYEIRYDFDLDGAEVEIPENCVLKFEGGKLFSGTLVGNNSVINASPLRIFNSMSVTGTWSCVAMVEWFGGDFQKTLDAFNNIKLLGNKTYQVSETILMPARSKISGEGNSSIIESDGDFTLIKMGYYCTLFNLSVRLNTISCAIDISTKHLSNTFTGVHEASTGNTNILISGVTINSTYDYIENNANAIQIISDGDYGLLTALKGFWGVRIVNTNIFGSFNYGIYIDNGRAEGVDNTIEPWITDCSFDRVTASQVLNFAYVGREGINNTWVPQRIEFIRCSMQSRDNVGTQYEQQKYAIIKHGIDINFIDCTPWDFESTNPPFLIYYGCQVNISGGVSFNYHQAIVELGGEYDGKLPYTCTTSINSNASVSEFLYKPNILDDSKATYREAFGDLPDGCYYCESTKQLWNYLNLDVLKCSQSEAVLSETLPVLTKKTILRGDTYSITFQTNAGISASASCLYSSKNENSTIEWIYNFKEIPSFDTLDDITADYKSKNEGAFVLIDGQLARIYKNRIIDMRGRLYMPSYYQGTVANLPDLSNYKYNDGYCVYVNGQTKPVYYSYRDKLWLDADGADATLYHKGRQEPVNNKVVDGFTFYSTKYKKLLIPSTIERTVQNDGSIIFRTTWVDVHGFTPNISVGTSAQRPTLTTSDSGFQYFDTTLNKPIYWTGTAWVDATGAEV